MRFYIGTIELIFLLGAALIVPLGICLASHINPELSQSKLLTSVRWIQPLAAALVLLSFAFHPGLAAGILVLPWLAVCATIGIVGVSNLIHLKYRSMDLMAITVAFLFIPVGGFWLASSRFGMQPMDIGEPIVFLTAVHFHFTAFAAPLIAAGLGHYLKYKAGHLYKIWCLAVGGLILGTPLVAIGFVYSPLIKIVAVAVLVVSLMVLASLFVVPLRRVKRFSGRVLLLVSGLSIWMGMALALAYAIGEFRQELILTISQMGKTHGWLNGVGFSLCGLLGWNRIFSDEIGESKAHS